MYATNRKLINFTLSLCTSMLTAWMALGAPALSAAPGTLATSPLFLSSAVQPNIALMLDDSLSMHWEALLNKGTVNPGGVTFTVNNGELFHPPGSYTAAYPSGNLAIDAALDREDRRLVCRGFNVMAYDPGVQYTPWAGKDKSGNPYPDMTLTAARDNPYDPSVTTDISNHVYFAWTDMDGDGEYDGPGSTSASAPADPTTDECGDVSSNSGGVAVITLPATASGSSPDSQQNYANWWSYYRNREYVAKRSLSQTISQSTSRMGLATINNTNGYTAITDIDDISTPVNATAAANKQKLLEELFETDSLLSLADATPLRQALQNAGDYYDGKFNTWGTSPILSAASGGECQQNFTLLMSDGIWNGGTPTSNSIGNADTDNNTLFDGASYADGTPNVSNTLADVAMYYYENDLAPNLQNRVPTTSLDPAGIPGNRMHQHMKTFVVHFGLDGHLTSNPADPTVAFDATNGGPWPTPDPVNDPLTLIDDMRHAAWNGRGRFMNTLDPQQLITSLDASLGSISGLIASGSAVALNTSSLSANSRLYLALLNSGRWSGDLHSYALDGVTGAINTTRVWSAAKVLDNRDLVSKPRTIMTYNGTDGIPFQWANLTVAQVNDLRTSTSGGTDTDATGYARMMYLRGERNCEQGNTGTCSHTVGASTYTAKSLRLRDSRLGDLVHSGPVYVGTPEVNWPDSLPNTTPYSNFRLANQSRTGVIYVGANDGMLHGFLESTGKEVLGYIPSMLFSSTVDAGLHYLADPAYTHRYYVDLRPSVTDAYIKTSTGGTTGWKTVLVGGLRGGGRGLFALDITTPGFSESGTGPADTVMWEFDSSDDADLGHTFSQPSIVPLNNGKWGVIFGNGYNDTGTGQAQLFILFIEGGLDGTWTLGTDYIKITTGVGSTAARNGLSTPAVVDLNSDGVADRVLAGDLQGNMWAFDISSTSASQWKVAYKSGSTPVPLFTTNTSQPITVSPVIVRNPAISTASGNYPNLLVLFGTGQYLVNADKTSTSTQSFYGVWDTGTAQLTQSSLVEQDISSTTVGSTKVRLLSNKVVDYPGGDFGWYMDLPDARERVITDAVIRGNLVYFNTAIPDNSPCGSGGSGWLMVAKYVNGGRPDNIAFDLNGDGKLTTLDEVNNDSPAGVLVTGLPSSPVGLGNKRYLTTTETVDGSTIWVDEIEDIAGSDTGRYSWEELVP